MKVSTHFLHSTLMGFIVVQVRPLQTLWFE